MSTYASPESTLALGPSRIGFQAPKNLLRLPFNTCRTWGGAAAEDQRKVDKLR